MMRPILLIFLVPFLAACASTDGRPTLEQIEEVYVRHAGTDAQNVMFTNIRGWRPAGVRMMVVEVGPRRDYLVELTPPCEMNLRFEPAIRIINAQRGILSRFDSVQVGRDVCRIVSIRQIDMEAVRADLEALRLSAPDGSDRIAEDADNQDAGGT
jgi:hypothetical protein